LKRKRVSETSQTGLSRLLWLADALFARPAVGEMANGRGVSVFSPAEGVRHRRPSTEGKAMAKTVKDAVTANPRSVSTSTSVVEGDGTG
jgi:hypothetical protein